MPSDKVAQVEITVDTELRVQLAELQAEIARLQKITTTDTCCAYCGEAYPQGTPRFGGDALTEHIKVCPEHPMRECERHLAEAQAKAAQLEDEVAANIVLCAAEHANFEATLPMLQEEVDELSAALRGEHEHPPESELVQIAAIAINWIRRLGNIPSRDFILSESARHQYNHGYAEGMAAERERACKAICSMCRNDDPILKDGHWIHFRPNVGPGGICSQWCRAAAIRAGGDEE